MSDLTIEDVPRRSARGARENRAPPWLDSAGSCSIPWIDRRHVAQLASNREGVRDITSSRIASSDTTLTTSTNSSAAAVNRKIRTSGLNV